MRLALVLTPLDDANLRLASQVGSWALWKRPQSFSFVGGGPVDKEQPVWLVPQVGVEDIVYYNMEEMPSTVETLVGVREQVRWGGVRQCPQRSPNCV